jgi:hypothetical protein
MLPNFLVVGAGRSGTTSLHHYLQQHPEIYVPGVKSPSYFYCHRLPQPKDRVHERVTRDYFVPDTATYESLFDGVQEETAIGEVSPAYLASMRAIAHIADKIPTVKIVIILRNPVERFYARYVARHRDGLEPLETVEALLEKERKKPFINDEAVGAYLSSGFCSHFIEAYLERFSREQLHLTFFDDLEANAPAYMRKLFEFLEVCPDFEPDLSKRENVSGGSIRNPFLRAIWTKSVMARVAIRPYVPKGLRDFFFRRIMRNIVSQPLDSRTRLELVRIYRSEIEKLQMLTGRDLTHWLQERR